MQLDQCWAKTDPITGLPALTVRDHCLIVGMVAEVLRELAPPGLRRFLPEGSGTLAAAHDIGKITPGFQLKASAWSCPGVISAALCESNHAKVSQAFLASLPTFRHPNGRPFSWVMAAGGHHGKYPTPFPDVGKFPEGDDPWPARLRGELLLELIEILGPLPTADVPKGPLLHAFTGFMSFADWIGSDLRWFPLDSRSPLQNRITPPHAREAAEAAAGEIAWHRRDTMADLGFQELFPSITGTPRPLQQALVAAMDQPGLYIVEAPMGEGKTEAALAGAYRRWSTGGERGLYFALPSQLTSERIHERVARFLEQVIADPVVLSLVHGNAWLHPERLRSITPSTTPGTISNDLLEWYASGRKAMLAAFGTGTIDQALMSTLPVKHSGLRLFALAGKVVIIDEVHSYDPYTSALLDRTVAWLLELGGSVIILSATLSRSRRASLLKAAGASEEQPSMAYPLITKAVPGNPIAESIPFTTDTARSLAVDLVFAPADSPAVMEMAAEAAESGACVLIIRNTVALAQQTYRDIKASLRDRLIPVGLLHSRFPQYHRQQAEDHWTEVLGRSGDKRPGGCVLVATQVVEQSVDIDADLLLTDLAPVDLILQRLGRLHRHHRPRPAGFKTPRCHVLMPDLPEMESATAKELKQALGPSAFVYPPISLLRAWRILRNWPDHRLHLPRDIRPLVEAASKTPPENISSAEVELAELLETETTRMLNKAGIQDVFRSPMENDREGHSTRWINQPTARLVLLSKPPVRQGNLLTLTFKNGYEISFYPGAFSHDLAIAIHANSVKIPRYPVENSLKNQPEWLNIHLSDGILAFIPKDDTTCDLLDTSSTDPYVIGYHTEIGVTWSKSISPTRSPLTEPEDDGWF